MMLQDRWTKHALSLVINCVVIAATACTSGNAAKSGNDNDAGARSGGSDTHLDILCIADRLNNPPEPFHYSYIYSDAKGSVDDEADVTLQSMDITIKGNSGSHTFHGVRSNENSWNNAVLALSHLNFTAMSARLDSLNGTSAITQKGRESVNGYDTTKYAIDTTAANSSDRQQYETLFGKGAWQKGTIWMAPDGCAAKLNLAEVILQGDVLNQVHYDIVRVKR